MKTQRKNWRILLGAQILVVQIFVALIVALAALNTGCTKFPWIKTFWMDKKADNEGTPALAVKAQNPVKNKAIQHLDHSGFYSDEIMSPQEVTKSCLKCHPTAATEVMKTAHWTWLSGDTVRNGHTIPLGKRNVINNFCISVIGNWNSCATCHAGYGWTDANFDFSRSENVDCLVCHDGSGSYAKSKGGMPQPKVNLSLVAKSVRRPQRENCGICHFNGGGGMGVKHGDLDDSLLNANQELDVHMGKLNFQCIDCHVTKKHAIPGKANTTYSDHSQVQRFNCEQCHTDSPHADAQLNQHAQRIACQTCHIPTFARKFPTKMEWDWSQAGDTNRKESPHDYLKIKGAFKYEKNVIPEYAWYNGKMNRYVNGDKLDSMNDQAINSPLGSREDKNAKIWPFKVHRGKQIYDTVNKIILTPVTSGEDGYWTKFDWDLAIRKGAKLAGLPYSGKYSFVQTHMYWPLSHMAAPANQALSCENCHSSGASSSGRLNWKALGYEKDPSGG